ncbi:hypothetical protein [Shewanella psychropiezotolerans]|uniref:hypothetical protein n=1 Tax=Shewanella psychropiezotolerans TaxID=2593655 RepID=UPI00163D9DE0|nr:hypothetical protein [Shewanella psychropiezotolerans]
MLRKGYVDARYKPSYVITLEELEWLGERVEYLQALTERLCKARSPVTWNNSSLR